MHAMADKELEYSLKSPVNYKNVWTENFNKI